MNCYVHEHAPAVGFCSECQKALCHQCVAQETPRLVCRTCVIHGSAVGFEYRSSASIGSWPLIHICTGINTTTMRPKIAKGVIAIGNIAVGAVAIGGLAVGLVGIGGACLGLALALGGAAIGLGASFGGLAVGSIAVGGAAVGFTYAIGGAAIGPAIIDGTRCDPAARDFVVRWLGASSLPPICR